MKRESKSRPFYDNRKHCGKVGDAIYATYKQNNELPVLTGSYNKKLYENLVLNQVMECLPWYEKKFRSLYSSLCNNLFFVINFDLIFKMFIVKYAAICMAGWKKSALLLNMVAILHSGCYFVKVKNFLSNFR